jgi:excisionase family DNA binding protein
VQHPDPAGTVLANQVPQACARLGIGRTAFYELLKSGEIRAIKVGTRTLVPESELQRFIAERMAKQQQEAA